MKKQIKKRNEEKNMKEKDIYFIFKYFTEKLNLCMVGKYPMKCRISYKTIIFLKEINAEKVSIRPKRSSTKICVVIS